MQNNDLAGPEGKEAKTGCCGAKCGSHTNEEILKNKKDTAKPKSDDSGSCGCHGAC